MASIRLLGHLLILALTALVLSISAGPSAVLAQSPMAAMQIYAYDGSHHTGDVTDTTTERGPPTVTYSSVGSAVVDNPDGASVRPSELASSATYDYDGIALPGQVNSTAAAAAKPAEVVSGEVSSVQRWQVAAKTGPGVLRGLTSAERTTLDDALTPNNLNHIFDPKHNFHPLVKQFGSREGALEQIVRNIGGPLPKSGPYEVARQIGGQTVIIRGAVVNGVPRIGTAFTP